MAEMQNRVSVVKLQREIGVPGWELARAIVYGELSHKRDERGRVLVDPDEVAEFAKRYFAAQEPDQAV